MPWVLPAGRRGPADESEGVERAPPPGGYGGQLIVSSRPPDKADYFFCLLTMPVSETMVMSFPLCLIW